MTHILLHDVIVDRNVQQAESSLLKLQGLRKFMDKLKTEREKDDFRRHMRKYINIWLPDCPFEVSTTNRYTIVTQEAAATARRYVKKGDTIKYLSGNLVAMTSEEEKDLDLTRRDFSIVMSSRKKTPSLFLGPARFANHDCDANARLVTRGSDGMQVVAVRDIEIDEEITVTYGDDYFGIGNCECLCRSCEEKGRNGWSNRDLSISLGGLSTPLLTNAENSSGLYSFRRKRKYDSLPDLSRASTTPDMDDTWLAKRMKSNTARSTSDHCFRLSGVGQNHCTTIKVEKVENVSSSLRNKIMDAGCPTGPVRVGPLRGPVLGNGKLRYRRRNLVSSAKGELESNVETAVASSGNQQMKSREIDAASFLKSISSGQILQPLASDPRNMLGTRSDLQEDSVVQLTVPKKRGRPKKIRTPPVYVPPIQSEISCASSDVDSVFDNEHMRNSSPATTPSTSLESGIDWKAQREELSVASNSGLSDLSENDELDDVHLTVVRRPGKPKALSRKPKVVPTIEIEIPTVRYPGDYVRTPLLLGEAYSRWVDCRTCDACWVQPNGYYTRKECPRCERHSKLYGYQWPKTEKQGKGDGEERVMDHRTVHRFIRPEEEALSRKKAKGLIRDRSVISSRTQSEREESAIEVTKGKSRTSGRQRSSYLAL